MKGIFNQMYSVHAVVFKTQNGTTSRHEVLIHDTMSPVQEMHLIDPKLKMSDSAAGTFSAIIHPNNPGYSLVERFNTILKVYKGSTQIWSGRILSESMDFWNRRSIGAEGALAFLNDSVQPIAYYGKGRSPAYIINQLLTIHNQKVIEDRKIYVGAVTDFTEDEYGSYIFETNNGNTWQELQNNLLNRLDGHLFITYSNNKAYLNYYADWPNTASQTINFGDNLLDFTRNWNLSNIATVILPRGRALDADTNDGQKTYINLKSENEDSTPIEDGYYVNDKLAVSGNYLINNELYSKYGRVEKVVDFSDSVTAQDLFALAKNYILSMQFDELELSVSAVDLHMLTNTYVSFDLLDEVLCISQPHGMSRYFPIAEVDIALDHPENTKYTMSSHLTNSSISGAFNKFKSEISSKFKSLATPGHILDLAKVEASSIINRKTTGYVSVINMFENDEEGVAQAIVISSSPDWRTANKYWIWNMNGLAYYSASTSSQIAERQGTANPYAYGQLDDSNFEQPRYYDLAITMDGTIVANHIKTGILSDGFGYNYWNLETGEFSLQSTSKLWYGSGEGQYQSVYDLIYRSDTAYNRRNGSANYLNGTKDWAEWRWSGNWHKLDSDEEIMVCSARNYSGWDDILKCPVRSIEYKAIKGYVMTFSFEGTSADDWGDVSTTNAVVVSFCLVMSSGSRIAKIERAFSFETDWSRRYVTIELLDSEFTQEQTGVDYESCYLDIWIYNVSRHEVSIRRVQFERGNIPTDWVISDDDVDVKIEDEATTAYNAATAVAESLANDAAELSQKYTDDELANYDEKVTITYIPQIREDADNISKKYADALNQSLTQREILSRLCGGLETEDERQGVYLYNGKIYINGEYIRSGTIDAGLLRAGVITAGPYDYDGDPIDPDANFWDLMEGNLKATNAIFENTRVDGQFTSRGDSTYVEIVNGVISGYRRSGGNMISYISVDEYGWINGGNTTIRHGLVLDSEEDLLLRVWGDLKIEDYRRSGIAYVGTGQSAVVPIVYIKWIQDNGDGTISWDSGNIALTFTKGILTEWYSE